MTAQQSRLTPEREQEIRKRLEYVSNGSGSLTMMIAAEAVDHACELLAELDAVRGERDDADHFVATCEGVEADLAVANERVHALETTRDEMRGALEQAERWLDKVGTAGSYWHVQLQLLLRRLNIADDEAEALLAQGDGREAAQ